MRVDMADNKKTGRVAPVRTRDTKETLRTLKSLDYSYDDLARFVTYSKKQRVLVVIPPEVEIDDLVQHLDSICCDIMADWQSLQRLCPESMANFNTMLGSLLRVLVNVTFLFDNDKYPQHARLPTLFVGCDTLNEHIVHMCISWVLDLRIRDYKYNETGATLTNLITLLHNYVSYEFAEDKKRFCTLLLAHGRLPAFLCVTVDLVVGRVGTDVVLRNSLQQVCVEFWNAIVNWNIAEDARFKELRRVFAKHLKLKELMDLLIKRVHSRDEESIYFVTLLFDAEEFVSRFLAEELQDTRKKCLDVVISECTGVLTDLTLAANPLVLLFETLISIAHDDNGRAVLLGEHEKPFLELILKFVDRFEQIVEIGAESSDEDGEPDGTEAQSAKKLLGLVFRLYGAMHEKNHLFLERLLAHFSGQKGMSLLRSHLQAFHADPLLRNNDIIETEDVDRFYLLFVALKKRLQEHGVEEEVRPAPILSRTIVERFKSITPGPFCIPFPVAMSVEFSEALSSALDQTLVQNLEEEQATKLVQLTDVSDEEGKPKEEGGQMQEASTADGPEPMDEDGAEVIAASTSDETQGGLLAGKRKAEALAEGLADDDEQKRLRSDSADKEPGPDQQSADTLLKGEAEVSANTTGAETDAHAGPAGSEIPAVATGTGAPSKETGKRSPESGPGPTQIEEQTGAPLAEDADIDFRVSSPEFIDPADYESDHEEVDMRLRCKVVVGKDQAKPVSGEATKEAHQLNFDFRTPRWSGEAESKAKGGGNNLPSTTGGAGTALPRNELGTRPFQGPLQRKPQPTGPSDVAPEYVYVDDSSDSAHADKAMSRSAQKPRGCGAQPVVQQGSTTPTGQAVAAASEAHQQPESRPVLNSQPPLRGPPPQMLNAMLHATRRPVLPQQAPLPQQTPLPQKAPLPAPLDHRPGPGFPPQQRTGNVPQNVSAVTSDSGARGFAEHHTARTAQHQQPAGAKNPQQPAGAKKSQFVRMFGGVKAAESRPAAPPVGMPTYFHSENGQSSHATSHPSHGPNFNSAHLAQQCAPPAHGSSASKAGAHIPQPSVSDSQRRFGDERGIRVVRKNSRRHVEIAYMIEVMQFQRQQAANGPQQGQTPMKSNVNQNMGRGTVLASMSHTSPGLQSRHGYAALASLVSFSPAQSQQWPQQAPVGQQQHVSQSAQDHMQAFQPKADNSRVPFGNKQGHVFGPGLGPAGGLNAAMPGLGRGVPSLFSAR
mmetsp:Transcript_33517/g.79107  ORF Transcript_33517/g.79107 Transcript_33517/m.79107 type:complete len:1224 (-) Transcript_33517:97-3768(-)